MVKTVNSALGDAETGLVGGAELEKTVSYFVNECGGLPYVFGWFTWLADGG